MLPVDMFSTVDESDFAPPVRKLFFTSINEEWSFPIRSAKSGRWVPVLNIRINEKFTRIKGTYFLLGLV